MCDELESTGRTDLVACNYNALATEEDGVVSIVGGGGGDTITVLGDTLTRLTFTDDTMGYALDVDWIATHTSGDLAGLSTYRLYVVLNDPADLLSSCYGNQANPMVIQTASGFHQDPLGGIFGTNINSFVFGLFPELAYDSWVTIGLDSAPPVGYSAIQSAQSPNQNWIAGFEVGNEIRIDDPVGGAWFVTSSNLNGVPDENLRVLVAQFTSAGTVSGTLPIQLFPLGEGGDEVRAAFTFTTEGLGEPEVTQVGTPDRTRQRLGCTDATADNFDAEADYDDGSCAFQGARTRLEL